MSKRSEKEAQKAESIAVLRRVLRRGSTVFCTLRDVSRSGMSRRIKFFVVRKGEVSNISWHVGKVLGLKCGDEHALTVGGCGMDMGFHVVHNLSYALHGMDAHDAKGSKRSGYTLNCRWL